jgi:hypothetical protein
MVETLKQYKTRIAKLGAAAARKKLTSADRVAFGKLGGRPSTTSDAILEALAKGPKSRTEIAAAVKKTNGQISPLLSRLKVLGTIENFESGMWRLVRGKRK